MDEQFNMADDLDPEQQEGAHDLAIKERAYHEAGHAVAFVSEGLQFTSVDVHTNGDELGGISYPIQKFNSIPFFYSECCHGGQICRDCNVQRLFAESAIVATMSGAVALSRFRPREDAEYGDQGDQNDCAEICRLVFNDDSDEKIRSRLYPLVGRAQILILNPMGQLAVKAVAEALIEKRELMADEVRQIIGLAQADWIRQHADGSP
jgi:hypothetical protein